MTFEDFKKKKNIKRNCTLEDWLENNYIDGARKIDGKWFIPENARRPYTERKAKEGYALYKSFVRAYYKGKSVAPALYNISNEKFDTINNWLLSKDLIEKEELDGLTYYNATAEGEKFISFSNSKIGNIYGLTIEKIAKGIMDSQLNR